MSYVSPYIITCITSYINCHITEIPCTPWSYHCRCHAAPSNSHPRLKCNSRCSRQMGRHSRGRLQAPSSLLVGSSAQLRVPRHTRGASTTPWTTTRCSTHSDFPHSRRASSSCLGRRNLWKRLFRNSCGWVCPSWAAVQRHRRHPCLNVWLWKLWMSDSVQILFHRPPTVF